MREFLLRLRAALTPQALLLLAALLLIAAGMAEGRIETASSLERRIGETLSAVDGAGRVRVVIRTETVQTEGVSRQMQTVACGAVAVASGADNPVVRMMLEEALCALLGLSPSAVSVMTGGA